MMRKLLMLLVSAMLSLSAYSQAHWGDVSISYRMDLDLVADGDGALLKVQYSAPQKQINEDARLLLRFFDDTVIELQGIKLGTQTRSSGGVVISNIYVKDDYKVSAATFRLSKEQAEMFAKGVKKFRISTNKSPRDKSWTTDKIGKKLYKQYQQSLTGKGFADGF